MSQKDYAVRGLRVVSTLWSAMMSAIFVGATLSLASVATSTPVATLSTPSNCSGCLLPVFPDPNSPVKRVVTDDLTTFLKETLEQHDVTMVLVLQGSNGSSAQQDNTASTKVELDKLSGVSVSRVNSYQDFILLWHSSLKHLQHPISMASHSSQVPRKFLASVDTATTTPLVRASLSPRKQLRPTVALLIKGHNGRIGLQEANLAAAIAGRLRLSHRLTLSYSTHSDKADSLVVSTSEGVALGAAVLSTSIFRDAFNKIYAQKLWGKEGEGSGPGSDLGPTTVIRDQLPRIIKEYNVSSMLDSSCGSMHWMPLVLQNVTASNPLFQFMGTDVVCGLIANHTIKFKNQSNYKFGCVDYASQRLPAGYDLLFSRDSLQHVPLHAVWQFLNNVRASGAKYLLVGSYIRHSGPNVDIRGGEYYSINLLNPPFNCSKPLEVIDEKTADGKHMLLFDVAELTWQDTLWSLV